MHKENFSFSSLKRDILKEELEILREKYDNLLMSYQKLKTEYEELDQLI